MLDYIVVVRGELVSCRFNLYLTMIVQNIKISRIRPGRVEFDFWAECDSTFPTLVRLDLVVPVEQS